MPTSCRVYYFNKLVVFENGSGVEYSVRTNRSVQYVLWLLQY